MMKEDARIPKGEEEAQEELLNFDLDDLTSEDLDGNPSEQDAEIVDLVDLLQKGEEEMTRGAQPKGSPEESASDTQPELELDTGEMEGIQELTSDEEAPQESVLDLSDITLDLNQAEAKQRSAKDVSEQEEITAADLEGLLEEEPQETLRLDLNAAERPKAVGMDEGEDLSEPSLEGLLDAELGEEKGFGLEEEAVPKREELGLEGESVTGEAEERMESEVPLEVGHREEPEETPAGHEEAPEMTAQEPAVEEPSLLVQGIGGISEEHLEAMITRVVEDVVERVARETMVHVAEKLITEAIEALKKSIESGPRE
jgi:hypothetical protein